MLNFELFYKTQVWYTALRFSRISLLHPASTMFNIVLLAFVAKREPTRDKGKVEDISIFQFVFSPYIFKFFFCSVN